MNIKVFLHLHHPVLTCLAWKWPIIKLPKQNFIINPPNRKKKEKSKYNNVIMMMVLSTFQCLRNQRVIQCNASGGIKGMKYLSNSSITRKVKYRKRILWISITSTCSSNPQHSKLPFFFFFTFFYFSFFRGIVFSYFQGQKSIYKMCVYSCGCTWIAAFNIVILSPLKRRTQF